VPCGLQSANRRLYDQATTAKDLKGPHIREDVYNANAAELFRAGAADCLVSCPLRLAEERCMAASVEVRAKAEGDSWSADVWVHDPRGRSRHRVRVSQEELLRYGRGRSVDELIRASFEFLLQREPPSSILADFDLSTIERYFPEFRASV
jgi:hypothetical protein